MARSVVAVALISLVTICVGQHSRDAAGGADSDDADGAEDEQDEQDHDEEGCLNDDFEENQLAEHSSALVWDEISSWNNDEFHDARISIDAVLCPGEHDWYLIPMEELGFDSHIVRIDGLVMGTSWCGHLEGCGGASLSDAPENTLAVEVYDAASMVLLAADIAPNGRVDINAWEDKFGKDLRVHVYSPSAAASFAYELHVDVRSYDGEDECEC